MTPKNYPLAEHDAHARSVGPGAHWEQVRRTINGVPVDDDQVILIVQAIINGLSVSKDDAILDLACGNGALSSHLFEKCAELIGVDLSPYLIGVADRVFARPPHYQFLLDDAVSYVQHEANTARFTKVLIYGALQYFPRQNVALVLKALSERFSRVSKVFIGNIPNRRMADRFYRDRTPTSIELNDHEARVGIWYVPEELEQIAHEAGWRAKCSTMPFGFYASSYRFDITLERVV